MADTAGVVVAVHPALGPTIQVSVAAVFRAALLVAPVVPALLPPVPSVRVVPVVKFPETAVVVEQLVLEREEPEVTEQTAPAVVAMVAEVEPIIPTLVVRVELVVMEEPEVEEEVVEAPVPLVVFKWVVMVAMAVLAIYVLGPCAVPELI
jgi:hypothetical protein